MKIRRKPTIKATNPRVVRKWRETEWERREKEKKRERGKEKEFGSGNGQLGRPIPYSWVA